MLQFKTVKLDRLWKILRASITVTICGVVRVSENRRCYESKYYSCNNNECAKVCVVTIVKVATKIQLYSCEKKKSVKKDVVKEL